MEKEHRGRVSQPNVSLKEKLVEGLKWLRGTAVALGFLAVLWAAISAWISFRVARRQHLEPSGAWTSFLSIYFGGLTIVAIVSSTGWIKSESLRAVVQFLLICLAGAVAIFYFTQIT